MDKSRIEEKLRKLRAMAAENSGATPNEREVAMKLMEELAAEYCVDLGKLHDINPSEVVTALSFLRFNYNTAAYLGIAGSVSRLFNCAIMGTYDEQGMWCFRYYGRKEAIEQTDYLVTYLIREVRKISTFGVFKKNKLSIEHGFASAVGNRVNEILRERGKSASTTALVKSEFNLAIDIMRKQHPNLRRINTSGNADRWGVGYTAGQKASFSKGVSGAQRKMLG